MHVFLPVGRTIGQVCACCVERIQNVARVATAQQKKVCRVFRRQVLCQRERWRVAKRVQKGGLFPKNGRGHNFDTLEVWALMWREGKAE